MGSLMRTSSGSPILQSIITLENMHDALWMSGDCELLEIASPGTFETVKG
jgi:hypothetical protein